MSTLKSSFKFNKNLRLFSEVKIDETKIKMHKDMFGIAENDPRIYGASSSKKDDITIINKAVFTSCRFNDNCPPWSIKAKKISHDKKERETSRQNICYKLQT